MLRTSVFVIAACFSGLLLAAPATTPAADEDGKAAAKAEATADYARFEKLPAKAGEDASKAAEAAGKQAEPAAPAADR